MSAYFYVYNWLFSQKGGNFMIRTDPKSQLAVAVITPTTHIP